MNRQLVRFTVDLSIHEGKLEEFERLAEAMIAGSEKEPGTLVYDWYFSADRRQCRLLEAYSDANAVLGHINGPVVRELVPKILGVSSLTRFEVYGDPGPKAAEMLRGLGAQLFEIRRGLSR